MDERLAQINKQKETAINNSNNMYDQMLKDNQALYDQQNQYANTYEQTQNDVLDKQLAYNEKLINQQKDVARENMDIESRKAKNDYISYTNPYGLQAEQFASKGLLNSGVSETAKLGGYNAYQNRLSAANKAMQDAFTQYDNDINQARLSNDVSKAQNALEKLKLQLGYSENFYNNKNTISQNRLSNNQSLDSEYNNRYQTEYSNIQNEKAKEEATRQWEKEFAEQQRQYNEQMAYKKEQDRIAQQQWEKEYALSRQKSLSSGGSGTVLTDSNKSLTNSSKTLNPYTNTRNKDADKGTFSNGYQPNNINGVKLSKTGSTVSQLLGTVGNTGSTGVNIDNQNVWHIGEKFYVWDGSQDKYVDITYEVNAMNPER